MATKPSLYRCWDCGWYVGKRVLAKYQGECPNCCTLVDKEFVGTPQDLRELAKRLQDERKRNK